MGLLRDIGRSGAIPRGLKTLSDLETARTDRDATQEGLLMKREEMGLRRLQDQRDQRLFEQTSRANEIKLQEAERKEAFNSSIIPIDFFSMRNNSKVTMPNGQKADFKVADSALGYLTDIAKQNNWYDESSGVPSVTGEGFLNIVQLMQTKNKVSEEALRLTINDYAQQRLEVNELLSKKPDDKKLKAQQEHIDDQLFAASNTFKAMKGELSEESERDSFNLEEKKELATHKIDEKIRKEKETAGLGDSTKPTAEQKNVRAVQDAIERRTGQKVSYDEALREWSSIKGKSKEQYLLDVYSGQLTQGLNDAEARASVDDARKLWDELHQDPLGFRSEPPTSEELPENL